MANGSPIGSLMLHTLFISDPPPHLSPTAEVKPQSRFD